MNELRSTLDIVVIGLGATAVMDIGALARKRLFAMPLPNYALVGRWLGHMRKGRFVHRPIAAAPRVGGEGVIGWTAHYLIGIAFAALLVGICGTAWIQHPTLLPALLVGVGTVAAPFLLMQPGMGAGIFARRTPRPGAARLQSVITHTVFGLGLYAAGWLAHFLHEVKL